MKNKVKINKAVKLINSRLPNTYPELKVRIYKTVDSMFKAVAKNNNDTYRELANWTIKHWKKNKKAKSTYINTKYYNPKETKNHRKEYLNVSAFGTYPIVINIQNTSTHTLKDYTYLLLHELGHVFFKKRNPSKYLNEKHCDKFAIRWTKKFIEEKLI
ncbi:hypothetical protein LCGC14_0667020 [marine sediment metagenome]|uniref:Uncharacterized protein n=1 Tax=marine sediment metagenome TaxID=412755 RepID=A0A0F9QRX5_9ZZZZ